MNAVRRRPDAGRKKTANGRMRRGRPEPFFVRQVPTIGRCRAAARTDSRVGRPAVRFDHSPFEYDDRLSRITNNEPRLSSDSDAVFRRDRLMSILRPCAICHKFRLFTGFARARHVHAPTESHTGDEWGHCLLATKNTRPMALSFGKKFAILY